MTLRVIDWWLLILTVVLLLLSIAIPQILDHSNAIFLITICLVGIPHGALDHIIHFRNKAASKMNSFVFYARYIILIVLVAFCWYFFPLLAFGLFLIISAYHFGQSQLFYIKGNGLIRNLTFLSWGIFVLSSVVTFNFRECLEILSSLEWLNAMIWMSATWWIVTTTVSGIILMTCIFYLLKHKLLSGKRVLLEFLLLICLSMLSAHSNAVFAFSIYFGLWHSLRSLFIEYKSLNFNIKNNPISNFLLQIFPFSFLAIIFLVISYYLTTSLLMGLSPYMLFIMFISTLTVPHLFIMHDLYENDQVKL